MLTFTVIYVPPCYKYMEQYARRHGDVCCWTWLCQLVQFLGQSHLNLVHMIALSRWDKIALVVLFALALWRDHEGCCVRWSNSYGLVIEPILLWAIPQSSHFWSIRDPFDFSCTPSRPNKLVAGFFQAVLLDSSDCLQILLWSAVWLHEHSTPPIPEEWAS